MADREHASREEQPPLLGSWRNLYLVLVVELAAIVIAGWALSRWAS